MANGNTGRTPCTCGAGVEECPADMPRRSLLLAFLIGVFCAPFAAQAETSPSGVWWNAARTVRVEITEDATGVSGRVVWVSEPLTATGKPKLDVRNPNPALRDQPIIGLEVLSRLTAVDGREDVWGGGSAYDASTGRTYRCAVKMVDSDVAEIRGYVGVTMFGRTERWNRVAAAELAATHSTNAAIAAAALATAPPPVGRGAWFCRLVP